MARLEEYILRIAREYEGGPTKWAFQASDALGEPVTKQEVERVLHQHALTRKVTSPVPGFSVPREREELLAALAHFWTEASQVLFLDEKKFPGPQTVNRNAGVGYAPVGERLPARLKSWGESWNAAKACHVIGALGVTSSGPMLTPGRSGDVGLIAAEVQEHKYKTPEILDWVVRRLVPKMNPYPLPYSVLVMDNSSEHRSVGMQIESALNRIGAVLIWNAPKAADLNPIEKFWDVALAATNRRATELAAGHHGPKRAFNQIDLLRVLEETRVTRDVLFFRQRVNL